MVEVNEDLIAAVEKLKGQRVIKKDADIAEKTGFSKSVVSNYLAGRVTASKNFMIKFYEVFDDEIKNKVFNDSEAIKNYSRSKGIPFYDFDISAANISMFSDKPELPDFNLIIPGFEDCSFALPVFGHSMDPTFENGCIIICKKIKDLSVLQFGEAYLVVTHEQRFVKRILKSPNSKKVLCTSDNSESTSEGMRKYSDFDLDMKKILHLFIVKGSIRRSQI
jgi:transcriptional regulator with XRE-family HTH domain